MAAPWGTIGAGSPLPYRTMAIRKRPDPRSLKLNVLERRAFNCTTIEIKSVACEAFLLRVFNNLRCRNRAPCDHYIYKHDRSG